jgi:hypothetical protein
MYDYICEDCWHEQANPGFCEKCEKQNCYTMVSPLTYKATKQKKHNTVTPIPYGVSLFDDDIKSTSDKPSGWIPLSKYNSLDLGIYGGKSKKTYKKPNPRQAKEWRNHNYWFIGDVHGNIKEYLKALKEIREKDPTAITIQVGDMGLGQSDLPPLGPKDFFIQGNHDPIKACTKHPNWLGKYGFKHGVFYLGGAASKGFFHNELSQSELDDAVKLYKELKPEIVVTHDCPESLHDDFCGWDRPKDTRTALALEEMWQFHNPNVWAFGHFHIGRQENFDGTEFICVAPLESHQIRLGWNTGDQTYQTPSKPMEFSVKNFFKGLWK